MVQRRFREHQMEPDRHNTAVATAAAPRTTAMSTLSRLLLGAYGGLWRAAQPLLRRHKRLRDDFDQRLVPANWFAGQNADAPPGAETASPVSDATDFVPPGSVPAKAATPTAAAPTSIVLASATSAVATPAPGISASVSAPVPPNPRATRPLRVWIQAASGGEAWLAHSLVSAITEARAAYPALASLPLEILCTTWTRQGLDVLNKLPAPRIGAPASVFVRLFPLDRPDVMQKAVAAVRPDVVILLETELWPGLLAAAAERGIPVLALNARMTEKSLKAYGLMRFFWRECAPERILAISPADADRFARVFGRPERVRVMPNIKFDRVASGSEEAKGEETAAFRATAGISVNTLLVVLASVREEEEDLLLPVARALHGLSLDGNPAAVAIAPRHMHRAGAWQDKLQSVGLPCRLRSASSGAETGGTATPQEAGPPVYVWDTFGELSSLYAIADAVYVGGSLVPLGGQNFLEPLAQGVIPFVGPHIDNFFWIGRELFDEGLAVMLPDPAELRAALENALRLRLEILSGHGDSRDPAGHDGQDAAECDWRAARESAAAGVRRRFATWLAPRLGGGRQAAEAVIEVLAKKI